jgi:protein MPE1
MPVIYYRFKSQKDRKHVTFDGRELSLFDLKCEIIKDNKLGKGTDFDLAVYNAQTNEEYKDDNDLIPRSTYVTVCRLPPVAPGKGTAQKYIKGIMGVVGNAQMATQPPNARQQTNVVSGGTGGQRKFGNQTLVNVPSRSTTSNQTNTNTTTNTPVVPSLPDENQSEDSRIAAMFQQEKAQWEQQQAMMANAMPVGRPGQWSRGANGNKGGAGRGYVEREPSPTYVCHRCGKKGRYQS